MGLMDMRELGGLGAQEWVKIFAPWSGAAEIFQAKEQKGILKQEVKMAMVEQTTAKEEAERQAAFQKDLIRIRSQVETELNAVRAIGKESDVAARAALSAAGRLGDQATAGEASSILEAIPVIVSYVNSVRTYGINTPSDLDAVRVDLGSAKSALTEARDRALELQKGAEGQEAASKRAAAQLVADAEAQRRELARLTDAEAAAQRKVLIAQRKAELEAEQAQADQELAQLRAVRAQIAEEKKALQKELAELTKLGAA